MATVYYTSDLHLFHKNIHKYRPFESEEEHRECVLDNWNSVVTKRDLVWVLGDSIFDPAGIDVINALPGRKRLIMGNHCLERFNRQQLWECFEDVRSLYKKHGMWHSHVPIHPDELRGSYNIHGHTHGHCIDDWRYLNVCLEQTKYTPIGIDEVRKIFRDRELTGKM